MLFTLVQVIGSTLQLKQILICYYSYYRFLCCISGIDIIIEQNKQKEAEVLTKQSLKNKKLSKFGKMQTPQPGSLSGGHSHSTGQFTTSMDVHQSLSGFDDDLAHGSGKSFVKTRRKAAKQTGDIPVHYTIISPDV